MKRTLLFAAFLFALTLQTAQAKIALVIGNDAYSSNTFQKLDKAVSDAHTIADKLRNLGYDVIEKYDLTLSQMNGVVREFHDRLKTDNEVGVFYYAGHAIQVKDNNYLIPLGVNIERDYEAETRAFLADEVLNAMLDAKTKINIIILDACRDNALTKRGGKRGLATMSKENTFILFSTQKDKTAEDGTFVKHLKNWIDQPNLTIDEMARKVRNEVRDATGGEQIPAYANNLNGDFTFNPNIPDPCKNLGTCPPQSFAGIRFVKIKKGCFMMGSPENEEHRDDDEGPQHKVCIEKDFWLSDTEITQEQWIKEYGYTNSMFKTATRPVEKVSWDDVQDFIKKLNSKKEGHFRLPSEAEWEYSARAGTTDAFFTGKCIT